MTDFETFWKAYPRKVGKGTARRAYARALKLASPADIMSGLDVFKTAEPWRGDLQFCPHASTWLNGERWEDEYETPGQAIDDAILAAARAADEEEANGKLARGGANLRLV